LRPADVPGSPFDGAGLALTEKPAAVGRLVAGGVELGDGSDSLNLPDGFLRTAPTTKPAVRPEHLVVVTATEVSRGRQLSYQAVPAGYLRSEILGASALQVEDGMVRGTGPDADGNDRPLVLGGLQDPAIVAAPFGGPVDTFSEDELRRIAGGLQEVTTADWRAALADAAGNVDPQVLDAASLTSPPPVE
jgi:hypothetical protein